MFSTIIELYDDEPICNVLAVSELMPENVVYLGPRKLKNKRIKSSIISCLRLMGLSTRCYFYTADMQNLESVKAELTAIFDTFGECAVDLTGGGEVALTALGMLAAEYRAAGRVLPLMRYDRAEKRYRNILDCEAAEAIDSHPHFTVEALLALAGGKLKEHGHLDLDDPDNGAMRDIFKVWNVYRKNHRAWSKLVSYLQQVTKRCSDGRSLTVTAPSVIWNGDKIAGSNSAILAELCKAGAIRDYTEADKKITFTYKNELMKSCLCDIGICLELFVWASAIKTKAFDDEQISVVVDWDGILDEGVNTINELDVVLTCGMNSLFISCKSGTPNVMTLHEIKTLASRFGGAYGRAVLVTMADVRGRDPHLWQRAEDMGVVILDHTDVTGSDFERRLVSLGR